ncbi:MAG: hypothetical protein COX90_01570 [Candidatus Nealsonbacteria bacterium CG_4_10_14_0_2_um_filter_38_17]|uniref:Uncharacterized protein n=1 Tax=Candidatus Nealsonbacteria bacterium CG_4_10_14_0_2_um_filter_38_17 TaxID=1974680 RepID=A0A2M7UYE7_9BACT|nr:MAG: hypothetical protein COX90_01570 [Candidatus Nealsonbacteria bacterium CG_4_10_14_0_2_um_filter_38_17]
MYKLWYKNPGNSFHLTPKISGKGSFYAIVVSTFKKQKTGTIKANITIINTGESLFVSCFIFLF